MAFGIIREKGIEMAHVTLDRELCLNADKTQLVDPRSREAAFNYGLKGETKNAKEAKALGYKALPKAKAETKEAPAPEDKEAPAPEDKAEPKPETKKEKAARERRNKQRRAASAAKKQGAN